MVERQSGCRGTEVVERKSGCRGQMRWRESDCRGMDTVKLYTFLLLILGDEEMKRRAEAAQALLSIESKTPQSLPSADGGYHLSTKRQKLCGMILVFSHLSSLPHYQCLCLRPYSPD